MPFPRSFVAACTLTISLASLVACGGAPPPEVPSPRPTDDAKGTAVAEKKEAPSPSLPCSGAAACAEEGKARIASYATPTKVEDWAGPLAGPTELERDFGVARSTLHNWQKQGAVIGLLVGVRKHAFPTEQFVDGRPVSGLGPVVEAVGEPRMAWLWLREPNPELGGVAPLARLKAGATDKVVEVARSNFASA